MGLDFLVMISWPLILESLGFGRLRGSLRFLDKDINCCQALVWTYVSAELRRKKMSCGTWNTKQECSLLVARRVTQRKKEGLARSEAQTEWKMGLIASFVWPGEERMIEFRVEIFIKFV